MKILCASILAVVAASIYILDANQYKVSLCLTVLVVWLVHLDSEVK